jgi:hypothetical protein
MPNLASPFRRADRRSDRRRPSGREGPRLTPPPLRPVSPGKPDEVLTLPVVPTAGQGEAFEGDSPIVFRL